MYYTRREIQYSRGLTVAELEEVARPSLRIYDNEPEFRLCEEILGDRFRSVLVPYGAPEGFEMQTYLLPLAEIDHPALVRARVPGHETLEDALRYLRNTGD